MLLVQWLLNLDLSLNLESISILDMRRAYIPKCLTFHKKTNLF